MDWEQLADRKCPKCESDLENTGSKFSPFYCCESRDCTFKIGGKRFNEITAEMGGLEPRERHFLSDNMMRPDPKAQVEVIQEDDDDYFDLNN